MEINKELKDALLEAESYMNEGTGSTDFWLGTGIFRGVRAVVGDQKFYALLKELEIPHLYEADNRTA